VTVDDPLRRSQSALQLREVEPMAELSPLTAAGVKAAGDSAWRGGRAVDRAGLENRKAERPREFESHPLRHVDVRCSMFDV
jgi:hypothetical protein